MARLIHKINPTYKKKHKHTGFSLIELSVVMIIVALVISGIVASQSLTHTSKLVMLIKDFRQFEHGIADFYDRHHYLPGDITAPPAGYAGPELCSGACYGDGSGTLTRAEALNAWIHLSKEGTLTGTRVNGTENGTAALIGENMPDGPLTGGGYDILTGVFADRSGVFIRAARRSANPAGNLLDGALVTTHDAIMLDQKIDDGLPERGRFGAQNGYGVTTCILAVSSPTTYLLTSDSESCTLLYWAEVQVD